MSNIQKDIKAIILAAGKGTRMKSQTPKVLHEIFSRPLLYWVLNSLSGMENIVVGGHGYDQVQEFLAKNSNSKIVKQEKQLGTGHAVMATLNELKNFKGNVLILCGDTPLITSKTIDEFMDYHNKNNSDLTVMSAIFENPYGYGRIVRSDNGGILKIVEERDATNTEKAITEVNAGVYCFNWEKVKKAFTELDNNNAQGEYYLTDVISWAIKNNLKTAVYTVLDNDEIFGINSREQLAYATKVMKERKLKELMEEGVTIVDPVTTNISPETKIEEDTIIFPSTFINGKNIIGKSCKIGPMAHIRGNCEIGDKVKIGNFVELKNAKVSSNTNISHLSYVGDAKVGSNVNIGAGTITANYNSITKEKKQTIINNGASIGSNCVLVAPVELGENSFIGAGSVITKKVSENSLTLTRAEQKEYKNWTTNKKKELNK